MNNRYVHVHTYTKIVGANVAKGDNVTTITTNKLQQQVPTTKVQLCDLRFR